MEKEKWPAESRFASSDEIVVDQLKLNAKNPNWRSTTKKISIKSTKDGFFYNFVENITNKKSYDDSCIS